MRVFSVESVVWKFFCWRRWLFMKSSAWIWFSLCLARSLVICSLTKGTEYGSQKSTVIQGTEKVSQKYALTVTLWVWVSVSTEYKHWGLCLCLGGTDQLDRFIDKSGFNDTNYIVYPWNVRKFKASRCYTRIVWFMLTWYISAPFVSDLAMLPSE